MGRRMTRPRAASAPPVVSVAQMHAIDALAIRRLGIPRLLLMDHAGLAVAQAARRFLPSPTRSILVCCGTGFNGGDGFAAARHLAGWGYAVRILLAGRLAQLREEPAFYAGIARRLGVPLKVIRSASCLAPAERWIVSSGLLVDALLGIGARGPVREPMAALIERMNRSGKPLLAVDVPSGLNADTGRIDGVAVKASATVTFGAVKRGCLRRQGPRQTGRLTVDPISIPAALLETAA